MKTETIPAPRPLSKNKAQRLLHYAQDLNAGRPVIWPKDANALRVFTATGNAAWALKGNEDILAGGGLYAKVEFGKVRFAGHHPHWKSFTPVKQ